ncbi:hypothetical protein, partial [Aeromonas caviae]
RQGATVDQGMIVSLFPVNAIWVNSYFGADRWVSSHGWRLAHIRTKIRLLEDENVLDGTPIRIPDVYDPSPAKVVLLEKGLNIEVQSPDSIDSKAFNIMGDLLCLK